MKKQREIQRAFQLRGEVRDKKGKYIGRYLFFQDPSQQEDLDLFFKSWLRAWKKDNRFFLTLDVECQGLDFFNGDLILISISWDGRRSIVFNPHNFNLDLFKEVLKNIPLNNQNLPFDMGWIYEKTGILPKVHFDTMIATQVGWCGQFPNADFGLANISKHLLDGFDLDKEIRNDFINMPFIEEDGVRYWEGLEDTHVRYSAQDALVTHRLVEPIVRRLTNTDLLKVWEELEKPLISLFVRLKREGIKVNMEKIRAMYAEYELRAADLYKEIQKSVASFPPSIKASFTAKTKEFNPKSSQQVLLVLNHLGIKTKNTTEAVLKEANATVQSPLLNDIVEYRALSSYLSKYLKPWLTVLVNPNTESIHPSIWIIASQGQTGRLSASTPNIMALKRDLRPIITARPGCKLAISDLSQYELRAAAGFSGEKVWLNSFKARAELLPEVIRAGEAYGELDADSFVKKVLDKKTLTVDSQVLTLLKEFSFTDLHRQTAAIVFSKNVEDVKSDERDVAKTSNYLILYGGTGSRLQVALASAGFFFSLKECERLLDRYFSNLPDLSAYIRITKNKVLVPGYITTPMGRKKFFTLPPKFTGKYYESKREEAFREAINAAQQCAGADAIKKAMVGLDERFQEYGDPQLRVVVPCHDEIITEFPDRDDYESFIPKLTMDTLVACGEESVGYTCPIESSLSVGFSWEK